MNWVKEICGKLGIKENEEWEGKGENAKSFCIYKLSDDGYLYYKRTDIKMEWDIDPYDMASLLTGKLKPVWKPKEGDRYCVPDISFADGYFGFRVIYWENSELDEHYYRNNLIFQDRNDAIKCSYKILEMAKEW